MLQPGMKVRIMPRLMGGELYGADDPEEYQWWLCKEVTVRNVTQYDQKWMVGIEEDKDVEFYIEEIDCIVVDEAEIPESDESLSVLFGGAM